MVRLNESTTPFTPGSGPSQIFGLADGETFHVADFDDPRSTNAPAERRSGRLKIIRLEEGRPAEDWRDLSRPGHLGYTGNSLRVADFDAMREKVQGSGATAVTDAVPDEFGRRAFFIQCTRRQFLDCRRGVTRAEQERLLIEAVLANPTNAVLLASLNDATLPNWYLTAGCVCQTMWNRLTGRDPAYGICDYDVFYFESTDLSYEAEDAAIRAARSTALKLERTFRFAIRRGCIFGIKTTSACRARNSCRSKRVSASF